MSDCGNYECMKRDAYSDTIMEVLAEFIQLKMGDSIKTYNISWKDQLSCFINDMISPPVGRKYIEKEKHLNYIKDALSQKNVDFFIALLRVLESHPSNHHYEKEQIDLSFGSEISLPNLCVGVSITKDMLEVRISTEEVRQVLIEVMATIFNKYSNIPEKEFNANQCYKLGLLQRSDSNNTQLYLLVYYTDNYEVFFSKKENSLMLIHFAKRLLCGQS